MKRILLILIFYILATFHLKPQQVESKRLTDEVVDITTSSVSVKKCFDIIEAQGVILSYNPSVIDLNRIHQLEIGRVTIDKLLKIILSDYKLNLIISEPRKIILQTQRKKKYTLTGKIKEINSSESLDGTTIVFLSERNTKSIAVSGNSGMYSISLLEGKYRIEVSHIGYNKIEQAISLYKDDFLNFELSPFVGEIEEVIVERKAATTFLSEIYPTDLLSFNSSDIFAKIRILPGVIASSASGDFQVNGGGSDENLILLDGIALYHSNRLNSTLPVFNGDAIKTVAFHKSLFPTQFQGRLSSVTDIRLKDGNKTKHSGTFSINIPAASIMLEGPIIKNKLSYMISARRSWFDLFGKSQSQNSSENLSIFDFNIKLSYDINSKVTLKTIAYRANDTYTDPTSDSSIKPSLTWKNELYAIKLNTALKKNIFNTTTLAYTSYLNKASGIEFSKSNHATIANGINEVSLSSEFSCNLDNVYQAVWGLKGCFSQFSQLNQYSYPDIYQIKQSKYRNISSVSIYYDNRIRLSHNFFCQIGLNYVAYLPQHYHNYHSFQPRISIKYNFNEQNLFYIGFSRMAQFYHHLQMTLFNLPTDLKTPSINGFKPKLSDQFEMGWKYSSQNRMIESSIFYKRRENLIAMNPNTDTWELDWNESTITGFGDSYGVRVFVLQQLKKFMIQTSYTYARSFERFSELENRGRMPSFSDVPHVLNSAITYNLTDRSTISLGGVLKSGKLIGIEDDIMQLSEYDYRKYRYPLNYRIDASYSYAILFPKNGIRLMCRIGLSNILGNPPYTELIDYYSIMNMKHCLPYGSFSFKF